MSNTNRNNNRPTQASANKREIKIFKLQEQVKLDEDPNYQCKSGPYRIKTKARGGTGRKYSNIERYILLKKDPEAFVGDDIHEHYKNCRLKVVFADDDTDVDDEMVGPYRLSDYELYYIEPTMEMFGNHATQEAIQNNIMPVFPTDVDMHTHADARNEDSDPLPNVQYVRLLSMKCIHVLSTTDLLDLTRSKCREKVIVVLNRFFLTKCDRYLPSDHRFDEIMERAIALRVEYQGQGNAVGEVTDDLANGVVPVAFTSTEFENFHQGYMANNDDVRRLFTDVRHDIANLQERMDRVEAGVDEIRLQREQDRAGLDDIRVQREGDRARIAALEEAAQRQREQQEHNVPPPPPSPEAQRIRVLEAELEQERTLRRHVTLVSFTITSLIAIGIAAFLAMSNWSVFAAADFESFCREVIEEIPNLWNKVEESISLWTAKASDVWEEFVFNVMKYFNGLVG